MNKETLKLIFMGTPEISAKVFEAMILDGYKFVGLIAQPDRPVGRKGELEKVPTKVVAEKYNIPVFQPHLEQRKNRCYYHIGIWPNCSSRIVRYS